MVVNIQLCSLGNRAMKHIFNLFRIQKKIIESRYDERNIERSGK